jgi:D-proline reductase (dithiol) PrdB
LVEKGQLGELAKTAYTFMGGIYSARKVRELIAPAIANRLQRDQVDLALLVPA